MFRSLPIASKIAVAITLFALPALFSLWLLASGQTKDIKFASLEVAGAEALGDLLQSELVLDQGLLNGAPAGDAAAPAHAAAGALAQLGLADDGAALALAAAGDPAAARQKLRALVSNVGDRSNLILDNVLDSYYATDVVLNRQPDMLDGLADMLALAAHKGDSADARAAFLVALGGLESVASGSEGSFHSAISDNADGSLTAALGARHAKLKQGMDALDAQLHGPAAPPAAAFADTLRQGGDFAIAGAAALQTLLQARVDHLRRMRAIDCAAAALLFAVAAAATLLSIRLLVVRRMSRLRDTMQVLASDRDVESVPYASDGDELGDMARTVQAFRETRLARVRLEVEAASLTEQRARAGRNPWIRIPWISAALLPAPWPCCGRQQTA